MSGAIRGSRPLERRHDIDWLLAIFGLGHAYLRSPSRALDYLSQASYPVYIIHIAFQFAASTWVFRQGWSAGWSLIVRVALTFASCRVTYEILR